ncbi:MYND finger [Colletotrichum higginsianum]|uniref:MYND finger n=2 Tax=Colletotrichum higginsianum TaxID=80884 RepID=H1UZ64_COLHI|nr:MYND finger [Colletotrichum higginsianum IMI 349063]OBR04940.1 MYND finger [Colletotrichum higginsianum IMI 349063]TIC93959.1 N-lysine methyltransferase SMYD2-B [Colletotrichum higginsianum]CCF33265.1 MYND finger [Colletotrichum higginsianum]
MLANDGIEVRGTKGGAKGGRSIYATRRFKPGDVIARFDNPAVVLPPGHRALEYCNHCVKKQRPAGVKLRACTGCKTVAYCGPACQRANWSLVHKLECKAIQRLHEAKPAHQPDWVPTPIRAAAQVMLRPQVLARFEELEGHVEQWRKKDGTDLQLQSHGVVKCLGLDTVTFERLETSFQVLCKLQTNAFSRTEEYYETGGVFLDTTLAMINHSCVPNALVQFGGRTATLRATSFLDPGDEIEISYIDQTQPRGKRHGELDLYHFECSCYKCQKDLDEYQVAMADPTIELNALSVMTDIERFKNPPGGGNLDPQQGMEVLKLHRIFHALHRDMKSNEKHEWLRKAYKTASWFPKVGKYAIEPFAQVVEEATSYYGKDCNNHECALAVASLSAYEIEPYKHIAPFHPQRLKSLSAIAIALSNTAPNPAKLVKLARDMAATKKFTKSGLKVLENLDQVSLCQMVLTIIDMYSPQAPSADWEVVVLANEMLGDIGSLPGRERENALINAWRKDPKGMEEFFRYGLVEPIRTLSELGKVVLEVDLAQDRDLFAK